MTRTGYQLVVVAIAGALVACSKSKPSQPDPVAKPAVVAAVGSAAATVDAQGKLEPNDPRHGKRKLKGLDTPVFVDGTQVAVLRAGELPQLPGTTLEGGAVRYRVYDYLKAIGLTPESVKAVHFHGNGDRVASIERAELLKQKDRFQFQFTSNTTGAPLQKWDTEGLKNEFVANEIRRVTIYSAKAPAPIHPQKRCHLAPDGECSDAIPYASGDVAKGTRVYLDGKMVGFVKRRQIGDALMMGDRPDGEHTFSVAKLVSQMGVDPASVSDIELMAGDDVVARASGAEFVKDAPRIVFTLPKHNHGKIKIFVPAEMQARTDERTDREALVSAVLLYKGTKPGARELTAISEDTDMSVQLASIDDARDKLGRGER